MNIYQNESTRIIPLPDGNYYTTEIFSNNYLIHASDDLQTLNQIAPMVNNGKIHYSSQLVSDVSGAIEKDFKGILYIMAAIHPEYKLPTLVGEHRNIEYSHNILELYNIINKNFVNIYPLKTITEKNEFKTIIFSLGKEYTSAKYSDTPPLEYFNKVLEFANEIDKNVNKFVNRKHQEAIAILEQEDEMNKSQYIPEDI